MIGDGLLRRFPTLLLARKNVAGAPVRSGLAALGIVIGVVAITGLGLFGSAFVRAQLGAVQDLGTDVEVSPNYEEGRFRLQDAQVERIRQIAGPSTVIPIKSDFIELSTGRASDSVSRIGIPNPERRLPVKRGRIPENWRRGVLVGERLARELELEPGDAVDVRYRTAGDRGESEVVTRSTRVHAVLESQERGALIRTGGSVFVPMSTFEESTYSQVIVRANSVDQAQRIATSIRQTFNDRREVLRVSEPRQIQQRVQEIRSQINFFLLGIGAISLVVAGVSILNVMLMSVMERREQIAVLRAVGYQRPGILRMVLAEALFLGVVGAGIGLLASGGIGLYINDQLLGDPYAFSAAAGRYAAIGFGFGVGVSVISGIYPAWKAATANTVDALRG